jgi:hypothetical protein
MNNEARWIWMIAYVLTLIVLCWSFVSLRTENSNQDNSLDCVRNKAHWYEPHGISPGWCGP